MPSIAVGYYYLQSVARVLFSNLLYTMSTYNRYHKRSLIDDGTGSICAANIS
mgnify:CR=1 FL=1